MTQGTRLPGLSAPSDTKTLIETGISRFLEEVPGLAPLKIIAGLELHGRGDVQLYRIEMPGPTVTKAIPSDAKVTLEIRRERFNELAPRVTSPIGARRSSAVRRGPPGSIST